MQAINNTINEFTTPFFLLGLGSNQGDRVANLRAALTALSQIGRFDLLSSVYESTAMYYKKQPKFLNMALGLMTNLAPIDLLHTLKAIEAQLGRDLSAKAKRYGPRPIDIDIEIALPTIFSGDDPLSSWEKWFIVIDTPELVVPHPRLAERAFVLYPLIEITRPAIRVKLEEMASRISFKGITRLGYLGELERQEPVKQLRWYDHERSWDGDLPIESIAPTDEARLDHYIRMYIEFTDRWQQSMWKSLERDFEPFNRLSRNKLTEQQSQKWKLAVIEGCLRELLFPSVHVDIKHARGELIPFFADMYEQYRVQYFDAYKAWGTFQGDEGMKEALGAYDSARPLASKLGLTPGMQAVIIDPPDDYLDMLGDIKKGISILPDQNGAKDIDFIHIFTKGRAELERQFPLLKVALVQNGMLWISWPKTKSKIATNLSDTIVRDIGLRNGLVDVKVCAIDADWSGLKFVYRLKDRK